MFKLANLIKIIKFGVYLALLTPLVYIPQTIFGAIFGKMIYFQIVTELTLPFFLYLIIFYKNFRPKINLLSKLILVFFGFLFLSSLLGADWIKSFWGNDERMRGIFGLLHFLALYFYIITVFNPPEDKKKLLFFIIIVGLIVAIYGIIEEIHPAFSIDAAARAARPGHYRVISTMGNPIFLAGYLIFVCFLSLYYYFQYKNRDRWAGLISFFLSVLVIFFTGTRGAFLGLMGGAAVLAILLFFNITKKKKIIIVISISALVFLLFAFAANIKILGKNKYWDFSSRLANMSIKNADGSVNGRFLLWQSALKAFKERPILGWGAENFDYAFDKYYNPQFYRGGINETWSDRAHNWFLDFLVMGGALGLAAYLAIFVYLGGMLVKKTNRAKANSVLGGLLGGFLISSFFEVDDPSTTLMLFVTFAVISLFFDGREANYESNTNIRITNKNIFTCPAKPWRSGVFLCFYVFVFLCVYLYNIKPLNAGINFISFRREQNPEQKKILAEKFLSSRSPYSDYFRFRFATQAFLDAGTINDETYTNWALNRAVKEMETALEHHPLDYSYFHTLGNLFLRQGSAAKDAELLEMAIGIYKKALEISPKRQATIFQLSTAYLFRGYSDEAVRILDEAVSSDEKVGQSHWRLGVALLADGKKEKAYQSFKNSINRRFFDTIEGEQKQVIALCVQFKDYNCAVEIYEVLVDRNPTDADLYAQLAAAYAMVGQFEYAKKAVEKAISLDPSLEAEAKMFLKQIGY